jgi:hypothetical protein
LSLVDDIHAYLVAASTVFTTLGGTSGGSLGKMIMLDDTITPDTLAVVYETAGGPNEYTFSTATGTAGVEFERPSFQILSRSTLYATARSRAQTAYTLLDGLADRSLPTATGTRYLEITAVQAPFFTGRDENDRYIVSTNYDTWKTV